MTEATPKIYQINEIFYSLQGEGYHTGTPAVFIRFSGCNRACPFCDTDFHAHKPMTAEEILVEVRQYPARHIVLTGGEPTLQIDNQLIGLLKNVGYYLQIETNGSLPVPDQIDWVTCSPKDRPWNIDRVNELKVVFQGEDVENIRQAFATANCFLQPMSGLNIPQTVQYILLHPHWRLSLQTHKLLDIR